jgi:hypothetical protein
MIKQILPVFFFFVVGQCLGQPIKEDKVTINGKVMSAIIIEGDTLILAELDDVSVTSPREFGSVEEYQKYMRYRRYANTVYPYAVEAIKIFRQVEYETSTLSRRQQKKHNKQLQKELKEEFSDPLKQLSRTQGYILTKMIERELDKPMYELIKGLRGGFTAGYWNQFGKFYGYQLKDKYEEGIDPILDAVLQDFDISYDLSK